MSVAIALTDDRRSWRPTCAIGTSDAAPHQKCDAVLFIGRNGCWSRYERAMWRRRDLVDPCWRGRETDAYAWRASRGWRAAGGRLGCSGRVSRSASEVVGICPNETAIIRVAGFAGLDVHHAMARPAGR